MSKSHIFDNSRKLMVFGTILVVLSMVLAACSANPIPETGGTPEADDQNNGSVLTPGVIGTEPSEVDDATAVPSLAVTPAVTEPAAGMTSTPASGMTSTPASGTPAVGVPLDPTKIAGEEAEISVVNNPTYGEILVGKDNMTLYLFTNDTENTVTCEGACLANWFPLATKGNAVVGTGVDESLLGTATLANGGQVVTYNGHPLYYFIKDLKEGDTFGQGVGNKWYVVNPAGEMVQQ